MKKITLAIVLFLSIFCQAENGNAVNFILTVSGELDNRVFLNIVDFCLTSPEQEMCIKRNTESVFRLYKKFYRYYDSDFENKINACENKYFPNYQAVELCTL